MLGHRCRLVMIIAILSVVGTACGSSEASAGSGAAPAHSSRPRVTSAPAASRHATSPSAPSSTAAGGEPSYLLFHYTAPAGWHYFGSIPVPTVTVRLTKDVSSSPPGHARLETTVVGNEQSQNDFAPKDPGRHGPYRDFSVGGIVIAESEPIPDFREDDGQSIGPCQSLSNATFAHAIECTVITTYPQSAESADLSESAVNAMTINAGSVYYELNWAAGADWDPLQTTGAIGYDCVAYLPADGGPVTFGRDYSQSLCGKLSFKALR